MLTLIFIAMYQVAGGAPAAPPATPPATEQATIVDEAPANTEDRNQRRCRVQRVTGSRLGARVCLSQAEVEMLEREGRGFLEDSMRMWDNQSSPGGTLVCDRPGC